MENKIKKIVGFVLALVMGSGCVGGFTTLKVFGAIESDVVQLAASNSHTLMLTKDGAVWSVGDNYFGQLGNGTRTNSLTPVKVSGLTDIKSIEAGQQFSLALKEDGTVWAWGYGDSLGAGTKIHCLTPVKVSGLTGVKSIAVGSSHSLALKEDGTVWAWGAAISGQLGDGTMNHKYTPVQVSGLIGVKSIACGTLHSLALKENGTAWAWGANGQGQLGDGTRTSKLTPVQVKGLIGIKSIACGHSHSLAIKENGTAWAWGDNRAGQLGDGTTTQKSTPVQISGLTDVKLIDGSRLHNSMAIKDDGTVWAWGNNDYYQLADGTNIARSTPVQSPKLIATKSIVAPGWSGFALKEDGTVWAWGNNDYGQLGDGTTTDKITPVRIDQLILPPVTGLTCTSKTTTSMTIQWGKLTNATQYEILINETFVLETTDLIATIDNLKADTTYKVEIRGRNSYSTGPLSQPLSVILEEYALKTPASLSSKNFVALSWAAVSNATEYDIDINNQILKSDKNSIDVDNLDPNKEYTYKVKAKNANEKSDWSEAFTISTGSSSIGQVKNVKTTSITSNSVGLAWDSVPESTEYDVLYGNNVIATTDTTNIIINNLKYETEYKFKVRAKNYLSSGIWSEKITAKTDINVAGKESEFKLNAIANEDYTLAFTVSIETFTNEVFKVTYDPKKLALVDFAAQTPEPNIQAGHVSNTNITILSNLNGVVTFKVDRIVTQGKTWTGVLTIIKFKAIMSGETIVKFER